MVTKQELIENPKNIKPHVVLLGAGASKAAFPNGDISGNELPVMNDLVKILDLNSLLTKANIDSSENFETIYSQLTDDGLKNEIEHRIVDYFSKLSLPETVTIYDQLLLTLREKDAIFTFNWDPFLFDAYQRNRSIVPLPQIFFLHGNVRVGACEICDNWGEKLKYCPACDVKFKDVPLLYPIGNKGYFESSKYTNLSWKNAESWFSDAFTITIFGYSAPTTDLEAVDLLKKAWFQTSVRKFEHVEVIDILSSDQLYEKWKAFTPTQHLSSQKTFENSRLWRWPRRSCESLIFPMTQGIPCEDFSLSKTENLDQLHREIQNISNYENEQA